jgi:hypothetical protein
MPGLAEHFASAAQNLSAPSPIVGTVCVSGGITQHSGPRLDYLVCWQWRPDPSRRQRTHNKLRERSPPRKGWTKDQSSLMVGANSPEPAGAYLQSLTVSGFRGIGEPASLRLQPGSGG